MQKAENKKHGKNWKRKDKTNEENKEKKNTHSHYETPRTAAVQAPRRREQVLCISLKVFDVLAAVAVEVADGYNHAAWIRA